MQIIHGTMTAVAYKSMKAEVLVITTNTNAATAKELANAIAYLT
jgi:hypothetical protein